jgi:polyisoprenoid-binding protein YceI
MFTQMKNDYSGPSRPPFRRTLFKFFIIAALLSEPSLRAQEITAAIDPAQTQIEFTLSAVLHTVHGTFKLKEGVIRFDPASGKAGGAIVVDATSGDTGNKDRDKKMHQEVLESKKFPEIVFAPSQVKGSIKLDGASQLEIAGRFRLHGQEHDFTFPISVQSTSGQVTAAVRFTVPYVDWGLKNPSTFVLRVSDKVDVEIHAVARLNPTQTK